jgi:hypothetical protein
MARLSIGWNRSVTTNTGCDVAEFRPTHYRRRSALALARLFTLKMHAKECSSIG